MPTMTKSTSSLTKLSSLRWLVGFLGSKKQFGWWDCSFLDETGIRFLSTTFPRSAHSAAIQATSDAAQRIHDQSLGKVGCYHLFRLPISIEDRLRAVPIEIEALLQKDAALEALAQVADASIKAPSGPVQIGIEKKILTETSLSELAAHYHSAFTQGIRCYPYFSSEER
jgi:hypothetical protein